MTSLRILLFSLVLFCAGCSNYFEKPASINLGPTRGGNPEFPFMLTWEGYEHIRFNVHTFGVGHEKAKTRVYIFLKRNVGVLNTNDFFVGSLGTFGRMLSRGTIKLSEDKASINVEVGQDDLDGKEIAAAWVSHVVNGEYILSRLNNVYEPER